MKRYRILFLIAFAMMASLFLPSCIFDPDYAYHYRKPTSYSVTVHRGYGWGAYPRSGYSHSRPNRGPSNRGISRGRYRY